MKPNSSAKNVTGESGKFVDFMRRLMQVPHSEIKAKLDTEKRTRTNRASRVPDVSSKREV